MMYRYICEAIHLVCETYMCDKRDLHLWQKRPTYMTKETYTYDKRDQYKWQKRPTHMTKETFTDENRDQHKWKKLPTHMTKETYTYDKRDHQDDNWDLYIPVMHGPSTAIDTPRIDHLVMGEFVDRFRVMFVICSFFLSIWITSQSPQSSEDTHTSLCIYVYMYEWFFFPFFLSTWITCQSPLRERQ